MSEEYDLIIVGSGPAGLSAAVHAQGYGLRYCVLERASAISKTITDYQEGKFVQAEPSQIPLLDGRGRLPFEPGNRETILEQWERIRVEQDIQIRFNQSINEITTRNGSFAVKTPQETYQGKRVILAIGSQGNPRRLNLPGETEAESAGWLIPSNTYFNPEAYREKDIVVIGGGDSAVEVALAMCETNRVTTLCRTFFTCNDILEERIKQRIESKEITSYFKVDLEKVGDHFIDLNCPDRHVQVKADLVILKVGSESPKKFLQKVGIALTKDGLPDLTVSYETSIPGLFLIGSTSGDPLIKDAISQGYEVIEHIMNDGRAEPIEVRGLYDETLRNKLAPITTSVGISVSGKSIGQVIDATIDAIILKIPIFALLEESGLTTKQIRKLLLPSLVHQYPSGTVVFQKGEYTNTMFFIVKGQVDVFSDDTGSPIASLAGGDFFGEMALLGHDRRFATIRTAQESILIEIPGKTVLRLTRSFENARRIFDEEFLIRLLRLSFSSDLDRDFLRQISRASDLVTYEKGDLILKEGDRPEDGDLEYYRDESRVRQSRRRHPRAFYLIRTGMVSISKDQEGKAVILRYLPAGNFFGEMAIIGRRNRTASVSAFTKVEVIRIPEDTFLALLEKYPTVRSKIREEVDRRTQEGSSWRPLTMDDGEFQRYQRLVPTDALLIDENLCIHCDHCVKACEGVHEDGFSRLKRTGIRFSNILVPTACQHCADPVCMAPCPVDAISRDLNGEVYIKSNCIHCGACADACPYNNIMIYKSEGYRTFMEKLAGLLGLAKPEKHEAVVKCDLCRDHSGGPACVRSCPTGAAFRVDRENYFSIISEAIGRKG